MRWRGFTAAATALTVMLIGSSLPTPLFPLYGEVFHLGPVGITLLFSAYTLVVIPFLLVLGPVSDVKGRREVLVLALAVSAVSAALFAAANGTAWLFAAQVVEAAAMAALQGTGAPTLVELDPTGDRRRASAVASAATMGGAALGLLLAGALAQYGPMPRRLPYLVEIALLLVTLTAVLGWTPRRVDRQRWRARRPAVPPAVRRQFVVASTSAFVAWAVGGLYLALVPSFVRAVLHEGDVLVAAAVVALMMGSSAVAQLAARRLTSWVVQRSGVAILAVGVAAIAVTTHVHAMSPLVVASVLTGVGHGLAFMGSLGDVNSFAPDDRKADVVASYYVVVYLSTALPVIGVGLLAGPLGLLRAVSLFSYFVFGVCVVGLVALFVEQRRQMGGAVWRGAHRGSPDPKRPESAVQWR